MVGGSAKKVVPATSELQVELLVLLRQLQQAGGDRHQHHVRLGVGELQQRRAEVGLAELRRLLRQDRAAGLGE